MANLTVDEGYLNKDELVRRWTALAESWETDFLREMLEQVEEQVHLGEECLYEVLVDSPEFGGPDRTGKVVSEVDDDYWVAFDDSPSGDWVRVPKTLVLKKGVK